MTDLEHKFYLADVERSAMAAVTLPEMPRGLMAVFLMIGLTAIISVAWA